jgi:hypothetical protein
MNELVTERELAQARNDPAFRQQFLARNLGRLLEALKTMHADLAVKLADRLQSAFLDLTGDRGN